MAKKAQPTDNHSEPSLPAEHEAGIDALRSVAKEEYGRIAPRLRKLIQEVAALYQGRWPSHEACEVSYHDFGHALDAALTVARMAAGWNRAHPEQKLSEDLFCAAVAAGFFHDSGYIKDKGDHEGHGGKFTVTHVQRGMKLAAAYLRRARWPKRAQELVPAMISLTDYRQEPELADLVHDQAETITARIIPTADLVAQFADNRYLLKLDDLFSEFQEMYEHTDQARLAENGPVFRSAVQIREGVIDFYEKFVAPRLVKYGHMDQYLGVYFGENRNPYHENIAANLSSHLLGVQTQWRRLGDVLKGLGLISDRQLAGALSRQGKKKNPDESREAEIRTIKNALLKWMTFQATGDNLGDMLLEMRAVRPDALAQGLLQQALPDELLTALNAEELRNLLRIAVLLQHLCKGPWLLGRIMENINRLLDCEASSILLAQADSNEMLIALPTGPRQKNLLGQTVAVDKGLAGWVFRNRKPALATNVLTDSRFDQAIDHQFNFTTRSLLAVPLFVNGHCIGVIEAINKSADTFSEHDLQLLTMLANLVSTAMTSITCQQQQTLP